MTRILSVIIVVLALQPDAIAADLASYRDLYQKKLNEILQTSSNDTAQIAGQYRQAVEVLLGRTKQQGNLDAVKAVMAELNRFSASNAVPGTLSGIRELNVLQTACIQRMSAADLNRAKAMVALTSQYDAALERLERSLVAGDKVDAAQEVRTERTRTVETPQYQAARALVAAQQQGGTNQIAAASTSKSSAAARKGAVEPAAARGLVLAYTFDDIAGGKVPDHSPANCPGEIVSAKTIPTGVRGQALSFDGQSSYVEVSPFTPVARGKDFTLCMWYRCDRLRGWSKLAATEACFMAVTPDGRLRWDWSGPQDKPICTYTPAPVLTTNRWQHLSFVRQKDVIEIYVDGNCVGERANVPYEEGIKSLRIGKDIDASQSLAYLYGDVDEVMVFSRALSKAEIRKLQGGADAPSAGNKGAQGP